MQNLDNKIQNLAIESRQNPILDNKFPSSHISPLIVFPALVYSFTLPVSLSQLIYICEPKGYRLKSNAKSGAKRRFVIKQTNKRQLSVQARQGIFSGAITNSFELK